MNSTKYFPFSYTKLYIYIITALLSPNFVYAHGGLSLEEDYCILTLGKYEMHFSGYQPENNGPKEFCEDIPETGNTIVVLDFIHDELRKLPIEIRIIKDTENTEEQLDLKNITIYKKDFNIYKTGTVSLKYDFKNKGKFIGLVTTKKNGDFIVSKFPFSVGIEKQSTSFIYFIFLALIAGASIFYIANKIRSKSINA